MTSIADLLRASLFIGACVLLAFGEAHDAYGMGLVAVTALAFRFLPAPPAADLIFVSLLTLDSWLTTSGAMASIDRNDHGGHFLLSAAAASVLFHGARQLFDSERSAWICTIVLTTVLGILWETLEYVSDQLIGTQMSLSAADTRGDVLADLIGASVGASVALFFARRTGALNT